MFLLNFPPGALGFLLLKTIYHHWPHVFRQHIMRKLDDPGYANHDVVPDLFIRDRHAMSRRDIRSLAKLLNSHSTVLAHDISIIPSRLISNSHIVSVTCQPRELEQTSFLYWIKSGAHIIRWVQQNIKTSEHVPELWRQMHSFYRSYASSGTEIGFSQLQDANNLEPLLDLAASAHGLPRVSIDTAWYHDNYQRSIAPLTHFDEQFRSWQRCFGYAEHYQDLPPDLQAMFLDLMDFFSNYHANATPEIPLNLKQLKKR